MKHYILKSTLRTIFFSGTFIFYTFSSFSQTWIRCSNGLPQDTAVSSLAKIGSTLFAGTYRAGIYKSEDGGNTWVTTHLHLENRMSIIKCMTAVDTSIFAGQTGNGVIRSTLHGQIWTEINNGIPKGFGIQSIFDILAINDTIFVASNGGGVFTSTDLGESWSLLYNNAGLNDLRVLSLAANHQFLFAGTAGTNYTLPDTGVAFVTPLVNGSAWTLINNGLVRNGAHLEAISAMTAYDTLVFAGTDDVGIHRSTDNGQTWVRIPTTDLNGDIWAIKIIGNQVYYGTLYHGIFTSDDTGLTFHENNAGLNYKGISIPDLVDDFVVMNEYIYAATSTGVYKQIINQTTAVKPALPLPYTVSATLFPNPFSDYTTMQLNTGRDAKISISILNLSGKEVIYIPTFTYTNNTNIKIDMHDLPKGVYLYSITMDNKISISGKMISQ